MENFTSWPQEAVYYALCQSVAPKECIPCRFCKKTDQLYSEIPVKGDWFGRGFVMRIGCLCKESEEYDDKWRTEFEKFPRAVEFWNLINRPCPEETIYDFGWEEDC